MSTSRKTAASGCSCAKTSACTAPIRAVWRRVLPTAPSVQYTNGIVDFQQQNCIGCGYCVSGCPFDIPKFNPATKKMFKCTLCVDRVSEGLEPACIKSCPTGCLHFGSKDDMKDLAETRARSFVRITASRRRECMIPRAWAEPASSMCCTMRPTLRPMVDCRKILQHSVGREVLERAGEVDWKSCHAGRHHRRDPALLAVWSQGSASRKRMRTEDSREHSHAISSSRTTGEPENEFSATRLVERVHHWLGGVHSTSIA